MNEKREALTESISFISIDLPDGAGAYRVPVRHWEELENAYVEWIEQKKDKVLSLTTIAGLDFCIAVSKVESLILSTPEGRAAATAHLKAMKLEEGFDSDA